MVESSSTPPGVPNEAATESPDDKPNRAVPRACPGCGYDMWGLSVRRCPECAYEPTDEELRLAERRAVFLELTRWSQWRGLLYVAVAAVCILLTAPRFRSEVWLATALLVAQAVWCVSATSLVGLVYPTAYRALARRCTRMLLIWYCFPALFPAAVCAVYHLAVRNWYWSSYPRGALEFFSAAIVLGFFVGIWGWWRQWPGLLVVSGMPSPFHDRVRVRRFIRIAMWPLGFAGIAVGTFQLAFAALDILFPHWWR